MNPMIKQPVRAELRALTIASVLAAFGISSDCLAQGKLDKRAVPETWIQRNCQDEGRGDRQLLPTDYEACIRALIKPLPAFDKNRRERFGERYDPQEYVRCRLSESGRTMSNCDVFILRRREWPEYWPDPKGPRPKWPDAPKESVHRPFMSAKGYWEALCKAEAGEFVYKTVKGVEGFLMIRPRATESDYAERDNYVIEDGYGYLELGYPGQDLRPGTNFFDKSLETYRFVEGGRLSPSGSPRKTRHGIDLERLRLRIEKDAKGVWSPEQFSSVIEIDKFDSKYGVMWRGIHRPQDIENRISGGELAIIDLPTGEILALRRGFAFKQGRSWLSSLGCPHMQREILTITAFVRKVLEPKGI